MFSVEIHFVSNGKKININYLSEFDLDSLRDCVYDFIPETSKLCMYSKDGVETFGEISNFTKEQYGYYKYLVKRIDPINPLWNDPVIVVLKKSSKIVELWNDIVNSNLSHEQMINTFGEIINNQDILPNKKLEIEV